MRATRVFDLGFWRRVVSFLSVSGDGDDGDGGGVVENYDRIC